MNKALLAVALLATGCDRSGGDDPITVSVIGGPARAVDPDRRAPTPPEALLLAATTQGLVRHDAVGQIEPGLAMRWAISDDGLYYTFRLDPDSGLDAERVARRLRAKLARSSRNPIKPVLGAIDEIVAVTPEVVEIRLHAARPNLLDLLAQPEMGIRGPKGGGTGPLRVDAQNGVIRLIPAAPDNPDRPPSSAEISRRQVLLDNSAPAQAITRFVVGKRDLILDGRFSDLPLVRASGARNRNLRFDPADGLFGLEFVERDGLTGSGESRLALAMAIDRPRLIAAFGVPEWREAVRIIPDGTLELPHPENPAWAEAPFALRRETAVTAIAQWRQRNPGLKPQVRIALPEGLGSRLLFALLRADWAAIGVRAIRVGERADADLRLIDLVAPSQSASWYLRRFSCERSIRCSEAAVREGRETTDMAKRAERLAAANRDLQETIPFIPIAQPMRWSLVSASVTGFRVNNRAVHPLYHLREDPR